MARSRNLKPGFFKNEDLADCGPQAQLLFAGLWTLADKKGRLEDRPRRIKAELFPFYDVDVDVLLSTLADRGFIIRYQRGVDLYIQIKNFDKHQNPHIKEQESSIPAPDKHQTSTGNSGTSPADSLLPLTDSLDPINTSARSRFVKPQVSEIRSYCTERGNDVDPFAFHDYYESNGWKVGRNQMKDWKAAVRTWEKNQRKPNGKDQRIDNSAPARVQRAIDKRAEERKHRAKAIDGSAH